MKEIWKNIKGFEGYEVSNLGKIKSVRFNKERILKPNIVYVIRYEDGRVKKMSYI